MLRSRQSPTARALHPNSLNEDGEVDLRAHHFCTDILCCIIFTVTVTAFSLAYVWLAVRGNVLRLYHGIDYQGHVCGVDEEVLGKPDLYWCVTSMDGGVPQLDLAHPICVSRCPGSGSDWSASSYEIQPDCASVTGPEGMASYKTVEVLDRYCIPDSRQYPEQAAQITSGQLADSQINLMESISSVPAAWPVLLGAFFVAVVLGYVYLALLRNCAEPLVWASMVVAVAGFGLLGLYLWSHAGVLGAETVDGVALPAGMNEKEELWTKVAAVLCFGLSCLMLCLACCYRHSIEAAARCAEVACDVIFEMPSLLATPVLKALVKGLLSALLVFGALLLYSSGDVRVDEDGKSMLDFGPDKYAILLFYMLVAFWILAFVQALYQFLVAYAVVEYYYTPYDHDYEKDVGCCSIWDGLFVGLRYHVGSLALGALLLAVLTVFQKMVEHAEKANKDTVHSHVMSCILCCISCCVHCCKGTVELMNKNAWIEMAISSDDFCTSARAALETISNMGSIMVALNGAMFVFSLFGTCFVTLGSLAFTCFMSGSSTFQDNSSGYVVDSPVVAMVVTLLIGALVSLCFMNIFDMASDTLLYCYSKDRQSGGEAHNSWAPPGMKELLSGAATA